MSKILDRLDPSKLDAEQLANLELLNEALLDKQRPALVGRENFRVDLPDPVFHVLLEIVRGMRKGQVMLLMPEDETFTTQAAANYLGVSRPFLIKLLENGEIPYFNAGSHRKIALKDLAEYAEARSKKRRDILDEMSKEAHEADLYDSTVEA